MLCFSHVSLFSILLVYDVKIDANFSNSLKSTKNCYFSYIFWMGNKEQLLEEHFFGHFLVLERNTFDETFCLFKQSLSVSFKQNVWYEPFHAKNAKWWERLTLWCCISKLGHLDQNENDDKLYMHIYTKQLQKLMMFI